MNEKSNPMPMMYKTIPAVAELNKVPGFDPLKFLRHKVSRKTNEEMLQLELPYQKLWFRLRHPQGRMKLTTLLDILAARHGCFISDLNLSPILRRAALLDLCRMDENSYPLSQWQDTVRYLTGDERDFASVKEIQAFIKQDMEAEG